jgi:DNA-binding response OmpR family regulator
MARVLLAESDRRIRQFVAGILADCGHAVETCADGVEATASLAARTVDVVVTDLVLVRGQGAIFGQNCAALGIPTITLSGCEFRADQVVTDRPSAFLDKPFRFSDLQCVLGAVADCCASTQSSGPLAKNSA